MDESGDGKEEMFKVSEVLDDSDERIGVAGSIELEKGRDRAISSSSSSLSSVMISTSDFDFLGVDFGDGGDATVIKNDDEQIIFRQRGRY